ncbi:hypothetical protein C1646_766350 [Rhizophagus diaphanus]|nr:hypothetical protein C1646_766350 [Rhizophagus diaphanus] [Rhizophagus sp. MUCL 43196]
MVSFWHVRFRILNSPFFEKLENEGLPIQTFSEWDFEGLRVLSKMIYEVSGIMALDFELSMIHGFSDRKNGLSVCMFDFGKWEINGRALCSETLNGFSQVFRI